MSAPQSAPESGQHPLPGIGPAPVARNRASTRCPQCGLFQQGYQAGYNDARLSGLVGISR